MFNELNQMMLHWFPRKGSSYREEFPMRLRRPSTRQVAGIAVLAAGMGLRVWYLRRDRHN